MRSWIHSGLPYLGLSSFGHGSCPIGTNIAIFLFPSMGQAGWWDHGHGSPRCSYSLKLVVTSQSDSVSSDQNMAQVGRPDLSQDLAIIDKVQSRVQVLGPSTGPGANWKPLEAFLIFGIH